MKKKSISYLYRKACHKAVHLVPVSTGGGAGSGKVNIQDVAITKYLDSSSVELRKAVATGKHFTDATITLIKAGEGGHVFFVIKMKKVLITSMGLSASADDDRPTESITLNSAEIQWEYTPQLEDGSSGGVIKGCWNVELNNGECSF